MEIIYYVFDKICKESYNESFKNTINITLLFKCIPLLFL